MPASRASSAFVCIRCELHRAFRLPLFTRRVAFSTTARRHDENSSSSSSNNNSSSSETAQQNEPSAAPAPTPAPESDLDQGSDRLHVYKPSRLSEHPLDRSRKGKGKGRLRETTATLGGVKRLGDDADILVLRDVGDDASTERNVAPDVIPSASSTPINILGSLQEERKPITPEEIIQQLDSLRPKTHAGPDEPHYVNQSTFVRLSRKLLQSFTGPQLSHYYSVTKGVERKNVGQQVLDSLKQLQSKAKRPEERSDWHPGTTQIDRRLPGLDVHQTKLKRPISKHLIVDQILRDVWKLVLLDEIESPGELELSLKPWQLSLLASTCTCTTTTRVP